MTDFEFLNVLPKKVLVNIILDINDEVFMEKIKGAAQEHYIKEMNMILDKQKKLDFTNLSYLKKYSVLEMEYEKLEKMFGKLFEI
ncbi:MAG: hypothetical protein J6B50_03845 [Lachnospiraceae bacterium]|nr:hypothetical protein [Lachnospiraceae bacterium]